MYRIDDVRCVIDKAARAVFDQRDYLGELDGKSGDGDLGLSMELAFEALRSTAVEYNGTSISDMLTKAAMNCNRAAPSTMGTLLSAGILSIAKAAKGRETLLDEDVVRLPRIFAEAIMVRGKAKPGDKTILDAMLPLADTLEAAFAGGLPIGEAFHQAAKTARRAAESTAGIRAAAGRAKWLGDRAAEYPDGGAILCAVIAEGLARTADPKNSETEK